MDIETAVEKKRQLEQELCAEIRSKVLNFEKETGLSVRAIDIEILEVESTGVFKKEHCVTACRTVVEI